MNLKLTGKISDIKKKINKQTVDQRNKKVDQNQEKIDLLIDMINYYHNLKKKQIISLDFCL